MYNKDIYLVSKNRSKEIFEKNKQIYCPYFKQNIILNSDGFHHLQFSSRRERDKKEQILKFNLLPLAISIIKKSGTLQEYRKLLSPVGKRSQKESMTICKIIEYWSFIAINDNKTIKIKVVLRRIGNGNIIFWSVMPAIKLKTDILNKIRQLADKGIDDE
ncbi:MAG: hypothetical protein NTY11_02405 [Candidatus Parcubacteria bacterium]|nr:hypothetical protein [Candidatus Parcubacteria bacterium]